MKSIRRGVPGRGHPGHRRPSWAPNVCSFTTTLALACLVILTACSQDLDLDGRTYPCQSDGDCPSGQVCNAEQVCEADGQQQTPDADSGGDLDAQDAPSPPDADTSPPEDADAQPEPDSDPDTGGDTCSPNPDEEICDDEQGVEFEDLAPNVFIVLDTSGSMTQMASASTTRMEEAQSALQQMATDFGDTTRLGLSVFPSGVDDCNSSSENLVPMGWDDGMDFHNQVNSISAAGGTPTGAALNDVRQFGWLHDSRDTLDAYREKLTILITDGPLNGCDTEHPPVDRAAALAADGFPVHVIGISDDVDEGLLAVIAQAGGTTNPNSDEDYYSSNNATTLIFALSDIISRTGSEIASCEYTIDAPDDPDDIQVLIAGDEAAFNIEDESDKLVVILEEEACQDLRSLDADEAYDQFVIKTNCTIPCD
jgi:hypothetical protein